MGSPVTFLIIDSTGHGGLARAVVNVANELAGHRDVRMISVLRRAATPRYRLDPRIRHEVLVDVHAGLSVRQRLLSRRPSRIAAQDAALSRLTDVTLARRLGALGPGIVVSTRPTLHLAATTWCPPSVQVVGWDHKNFPTRFARPWLAGVLQKAVPALDAYVVLTHADADDYLRALPVDPERLTVIRNALPWPPADSPAPLVAPVVAAAGRLVPVKGFGRMIEAFVPVARKHPEWRLEIHGEGPQRDSLQRRVDAHGLAAQITLAGYTNDFAGALRGASAFAMTSRAEGFPMVLLEAMSQGLPLVSMDCPRGPGEIVDDGQNGVLVPDGDRDGFTEALLGVIEDADLRHRMGKQAWADAGRYTTDTITCDWLSLLERLDGQVPR